MYEYTFVFRGIWLFVHIYMMLYINILYVILLWVGNVPAVESPEPPNMAVILRCFCTAGRPSEDLGASVSTGNACAQAICARRDQQQGPTKGPRAKAKWTIANKDLLHIYTSCYVYIYSVKIYNFMYVY